MYIFILIVFFFISIEATSLEIDELQAIISEANELDKSVVREISNFGRALKNIFIVHQGQQVYMTGGN